MVRARENNAIEMKPGPLRAKPGANGDSSPALPDRLPLFRYQKQCLNEAEWLGGRVLWALEPGLGKTILSLEWLLRHPEAFPAVVICPASVKWQWARVAKQQIGVEAKVLEGRRANGRALGKAKIIIANYDILSLPRQRNKKGKLAKAKGASWWEWLRKLYPNTIIIDEVQRAKNSDSKTSKAVRAICDGVPSVLMLSGTPLELNPYELFPAVSILRPDVFRSRWEYGQRFCNPQLTPYGWTFKGATHLDELHGLLTDSCMVRRRKADMLEDLPPKLRAVVPMPLSNRSEYERASEDFVKWLRLQDREAAERASRAEHITRIGYLLRLVAQLKAPATIEWINDWLEQNDGKLGVFAVHKGMIKLLRDGTKADSLVIDGGVIGRARTKAVESFRSDPKMRVIFGNIQAMGTGVDGLQVAHDVAFAEIVSNPAKIVQAEDRFHRIGSTDTVWCHYLIGMGTLEMDLCKIVQERQRNISDVLDGAYDNGDDLSVYDQLLKEVKRNGP